jgi:hypothetical protein
VSDAGERIVVAVPADQQPDARRLLQKVACVEVVVGGSTAVVLRLEGNSIRFSCGIFVLEDARRFVLEVASRSLSLCEAPDFSAGPQGFLTAVSVVGGIHEIPFARVDLARLSMAHRHVRFEAQREFGVTCGLEAAFEGCETPLGALVWALGEARDWLAAMQEALQLESWRLFAFVVCTRFVASLAVVRDRLEELRHQLLEMRDAAAALRNMSMSLPSLPSLPSPRLRQHGRHHFLLLFLHHRQGRQARV